MNGERVGILKKTVLTEHAISLGKKKLNNLPGLQQKRSSSRIYRMVLKYTQQTRGSCSTPRMRLEGSLWSQPLCYQDASLQLMGMICDVIKVALRTTTLTPRGLLFTFYTWTIPATTKGSQPFLTPGCSAPIGRRLSPPLHQSEPAIRLPELAPLHIHLEDGKWNFRRNVVKHINAKSLTRYAFVACFSINSVSSCTRKLQHPPLVQSLQFQNAQMRPWMSWPERRRLHLSDESAHRVLVTSFWWNSDISAEKTAQWSNQE